MIIAGLFVPLNSIFLVVFHKWRFPTTEPVLRHKQIKWEVFSWIKDRSPGSLAGEFPHLNSWSGSVLHSGFSACKVTRDSHLQAVHLTSLCWSLDRKKETTYARLWESLGPKARGFCQSSEESVKLWYIMISHCVFSLHTCWEFSKEYIWKN